MPTRPDPASRPAVFQPPSEERPRARPWVKWLVVPGLLAVAALLSLSLDLAIAQHAPPHYELGFAYELLVNAEAFGHAVGVAYVLAALWLIDVANRPRFLRVLGGTYGAGLVADVLKLVVHRTRPRSFDFSGDVWATFPGGFSWAHGHSGQSFPSAHTAVAVGLAVVLAKRFPQGRWLFAALAVLCGLQRIVSQAHFASDVFAGALVGWFVAHVCLAAPSLRRNAVRTPQLRVLEKAS